MKSLKNKRVFISGGAGVIGQELVKKLIDREANILVGDLIAKPKDMSKKAIYWRGDLNYLTQEDINQFDPHYFFHLAATFERSEESYEHWEENFWHNIRLSNHLMSLIRNCNSIERVVNCSSYLIYNKDLYISNKVPTKPRKLNEKDDISPRNLTGLAKLSHEVELSFLSKFNSDKFSSISARIYRGYGRNSRDIISRWIRDLIKGKKINVYNTESFFDYIYAKDSAEGLIRLALSKKEGIINLGTGKARRVDDVLSILKDNFPNMKTKKIESKEVYENSEADLHLLKNTIKWEAEYDLEKAIPEIISHEKSKKNYEDTFPNILIMSISKKIPMINAVRKSMSKISQEIKIFGADTNSDCLGKDFVDFFWNVKPIAEIEAKDIVQFCKKNNIGLIIPSRDGELSFFSKIKSELQKHKINVMISNSNSITNCIDKLKFSSLDNTGDIKIIPSFLNIEQCKANNFVVKEQFGAGAKSIKINIPKLDAISHSKSLVKPIFQPFIEGYEISIDSYVDKNGQVKGLITRKRDYVVNGESQITSTIYKESINEKLEAFISSLDLYGHIVLQAIVDKEENIHVIECNARFGGASTLGLKAGLDSFYWTYLESQGDNLKNYPFHNLSKKNSIKQIRFPMDVFK